MKRLFCILTACLLCFAWLPGACAEGSREELLRGVLALSPEERAAFIDDLSTACQLIGESKLPSGTAEENAGETPVFRFEGTGYESPRDALEAWLTALRDGDVSGAVSCYAIESLIDHMTVDALAQIRGLPYLGTAEFAFMPVPDPLYRDANVCARANTCYAAVLYAMTALNGEGDAEPIHSTLLRLYNRYFPQDQLDEVLAALPVDYSALSALGDFQPLEAIPGISDDNAPELAAEATLAAKCYGAEDLMPVCMRFTSARGEATVTTYAIQYEGRWRLLWPSRALVGTTIGLIGCTGIQLEE